MFWMSPPTRRCGLKSVNIGGYGAQNLGMPIEVEKTTDFAVKSVFKLRMVTSRGPCVAQLEVGALSSFK